LSRPADDLDSHRLAAQVQAVRIVVTVTARAGIEARRANPEIKHKATTVGPMAAHNCLALGAHRLFSNVKRREPFNAAHGSHHLAAIRGSNR
jgi:hypothetical protein